MGNIYSAVTRVIKEFRFAPLSFLAGLRAPARVDNEDRSEIARFAEKFGPPPRVAEDASRAVILSYLPLQYTNKVEMLLACAMQERGWRVSVATNRSTSALARESYGRLTGVDIFRIEDFFTFRNERKISRFVKDAVNVARKSIGEFKRIEYRGTPVALHAIASLTAAQPDGIIGGDERTFRRLGRVLRHSALLVDAADALYTTVRPSLVISQEKGFVGTCETFYTALSHGIPYVQWVSCHEPESVMFKGFSRENSRDHPFSISDATWTTVRNAPWDEGLREAVLAEFDRGYKSGDWFKYKKLATDQTFADRDELSHRLNLDPSKKTAVIYSHILNDANLFYGADLFAAGYEEWLVETVRAAASNPAVNWVLKLHPANVFRNARLGYKGEYGELLALRKAFGTVPDFLKVILPEEKLSPLSFFAITDWGITVRGTVGMELPCFGIPVLTAGTGRYSGKGFTVDSATSSEYLDRLRTIQKIEPLTEEQVRLGVRHAYLVFRARPAPYDALFGDTYPERTGTRQRDIELRLGSISEIVSHPQMQAIVDFLISGQADFLEPGLMRAMRVP